MHNFDIETTLPFPFFELNEIVTSTEVKKPSGVTYMILVLLKESKSKTHKLSSLLESFGVPSTLHGIYADEIKKLIDQGIIEMKYDESYRTRHFAEYKLSTFAFTEIGNKIFAEEQISTGKEKESKVKCYYDVALNQLALRPNSELELKPLFDSAFDEDFFKKFECKKDVEDYFNSQKGPQFQVKAAEVITKVELQEQKNYVGKYNCKFIVDGDNITIKLDHKSAQEFYDTYFTKEIVNKAISLKNKFKIEKTYDCKLTDFDDELIGQAKLPSEFTQILTKKYSLAMIRGDYKFNKQSLIIDDVNVMNEISKYADFIAVDGAQVYAYCPVKLELNEKKLGKIYLPLILVLRPSINDFSKAIGKYIDKKTKYDYESFKEVISICNITKDYDKAIALLKSYMGYHGDSNLIILNEVKPLLTSNTVLLNEYKKLVTETYTKYMKSIKEDSLESALKITSSIPEFIGMSNAQVLDLIKASVGTPKKTVETYELLSKSFNKDLVLNYVNPFKDVLKSGKAESQQLLDILAFNNSLSNLKKITGIDNYTKYSFGEDELIKPEFKKEFVTANSTYKSINVFKPYNSEYFAETDKFMSVFGRINDNLNILDQALKNPKNIKPDLIEKKIVSGDYQFVLINLSAKLEILLGEKFKLEGSLSDRLSSARKEKLVEKDIISDLFDMKENRNALTHPEDRKENYKADDLRRWAKEVFEIESKEAK